MNSISYPKARLWALAPGMIGSAEFIDNGRRRIWLERSWGEPQKRAGAFGSPPVTASEADALPFALWIGMNPSVAGGDHDDPTVRWEATYTRDRILGLRRYIKVNVMDWIATYPGALLGDDAQSPGPSSASNLDCIHKFASDQRCKLIVAAWGSLPKLLLIYADQVRDILKAAGHRRIGCVGITKNGSPKHSLRNSKSLILAGFDL